VIRVSVLHVRHIQEELIREFDGLIDLSDVPGNLAAADREVFFLTRALAAYVARRVSGCASDAAAAFVIDGRDDQGIDAIAIDDDEPHLWLIQTKWNKAGQGSFDLAAALKLLQGLDLLLNMQYARFNSRFQTLAARADAALRTSRVKITLVPVVLGDGRLADAVEAPIRDMMGRLNGRGPEDQMLDIRTYGLHEVHQAVRAESAAPRIDLDLVVEGCGSLQEPYPAYYGSVSADQIARWYDTHGDRLFDQNIRRSLGLTKVNRALVETLMTRPADFWYFNNGITVLCESLRKTAMYAATPGGPREFKLEGPSVVNGAQTVVAVSEAIRRDPTSAGQARVWIRLVSLEECPAGFATEVTQATNTQNRVEKRDLAALDPIQTSLRDSFSWALHRTYVIKAGESDPQPAAGCTNIEAAKALACAHPLPELSVAARLGGDNLWERGGGGDYDRIFSRSLAPHRVWRTVLLAREVGRVLDDGAESREGRAASIAAHGCFLITHIVFRSLDQTGIDDGQGSWEETILPQVPECTEKVLRWLIHHADAALGASTYPVSIFKNPERCRVLADLVKGSMDSGEAAPAVAEEYTRVTQGRRGFAAKLLVSAGVIEDGTILEFRPQTAEERAGMAAWLAHDARRGRAVWTNHRSKPLLWEADGRQYSPTGLVQMMRREALDRSGSIQGTKYWFLPGRGSLVDLAEQARSQDDG
jgi:hypothetical protein